MKQFNLFKEESKDTKYTTKIEGPIYEPKNKQPHILELIDNGRTKRLIREIKNSSVSDQEKQFLIEASKRHNVFHYENIADYYAHASPEMQKLMERSALVIIDFEDAIQLGYVELNKDIKSQYLQAYDAE